VEEGLRVEVVGLKIEEVSLRVEEGLSAEVCWSWLLIGCKASH